MTWHSEPLFFPCGWVAFVISKPDPYIFGEQLNVLSWYGSGDAYPAMVQEVSTLFRGEVGRLVYSHDVEISQNWFNHSQAYLYLS